MNLNLSYLHQVYGEALALYFRAAPNRDVRLTPNAWLVATGEPHANLNCLLVDASHDAEAQLRTFHQALHVRNLPAFYTFTSAVADQLAATATAHGMTFARKMPLMVCKAADISNTTSDRYAVKRVTTAAQQAAVCDILARVFGLADAALAPVLDMTQLDGPGLTVYLAYNDEEPVSTVATTVAGPLVGVLSMGTLPEQQRQGAGRALLGYVMAQQRAQGAKYFYLWSTAAGQRLYEQLGYRAVDELAVWTTGQSVQVRA